MESIIAETMKQKKENTFFIFSIVFCSNTRNIRELVKQKCNSVRVVLQKKWGKEKTPSPKIYFGVLKLLTQISAS